MTRYSYGIRALDDLIGGLTKKEMTVFRGRPSQGKSLIAAQLCRRHCLGGTGVYIASPEMSSEASQRRMYAELAQVPYWKIREPKHLNESDKRALSMASLEVARWNLVFDESPYITIDQLVARARMAKRRNHADIVIVDYLQKLRWSSKRPRYEEVGDAAKALAQLAKDEDLAVLVLSSLTEPDAKYGNRPTLADLRQSGDIQFEALTVLLLHRERDKHSD